MAAAAAPPLPALLLLLLALATPTAPGGALPSASGGCGDDDDGCSPKETGAGMDGQALPPAFRGSVGSTGGVLGGARDLVLDSERQLVMVVGIKGTFSVVDVSAAQPVLVSTIAPSSVQDAHGMTFDFERKRAFIASVSQASITCVDVSDAQHPRVLSTVQNSSWLYYSTHLSYDAGKSALFVCSAGSGSEATPRGVVPPGHSITSVSVAEDGTMHLLHRMTSWAPDTGGIPGKTLAYPVYTLLDAERKLMFVSNDARCTVEVIDVTTLMPKKIGNFTDCGRIEYNSQTAYDSKTRRLFTAAQHADSFAVLDTSNPGHPELTHLLQDQNRTACAPGNCSEAQLFAGATGVAFDGERNLAFVTAEFSTSFVVVDVSEMTSPGFSAQGTAAAAADASLRMPAAVLGVVRHEELSGEAIQYDSTRQRAYVVSRRASALLVIDVARPSEPTVVGVLPDHNT